MTAPSTKKPDKKLVLPQASDLPRPRSLSRGATVQALYQMDLAGTDINAVIHEFATLRLGPRRTAVGAGVTEGLGPAGGEDADVDAGEILEGADVAFFSDLLRGVVRRQRDIDPLIDHYLTEGWRLVRIDTTLRAILRAGTFELMERSDVPARVVISEYINIAHAFFEAEEPRVVNGVLDRIARKVRFGELPALPSGGAATGDATSE